MINKKAIKSDCQNEIKDLKDKLIHKLNQPLTYIGTVAQLLLRDFKSGKFNDPRKTESLKIMVEQIQRVNELLERFAKEEHTTKT